MDEIFLKELRGFASISREELPEVLCSKYRDRT